MQLKLNKIKMKVWNIFNEKKRTTEFYNFIDPDLESRVSNFYKDDYVLSTPIEESQVKFAGINNENENFFLIRRIIPDPVEKAILIPEDMALRKMMFYSEEAFSNQELIVCNINLDKKLTLICQVQTMTHATSQVRRKHRFQKKYCVVVKILEHFSSDYYLYKNIFTQNIRPNTYHQHLSL